MSEIDGVHFTLDCKFKKLCSMLNDIGRGIEFLEKIIELLNIHLVMPFILVDFPEYDNSIELVSFKDQTFENKIKFIKTNCFKNEINNNSGYSLFGIISESHISIHTFPENNYFSFDLYSCKKFDTDILKKFINDNLNDIDEINVNVIKRDIVSEKWFYEDLVKSQRFGIEYSKTIIDEKSKYQDIKLIESKTYGKVLILDGVIQITERDYFTYNEMLSHTPLFGHENPKNVFIIGGGDGCVLNEVVKHNYLKNIDICDIDEKVIEISKTHFSWNDGWKDNRVNVFTEDAAKFILNTKKRYSVIIMDSSDPFDGLPAASLYTNSFFSNIYDILDEDGIFCFQSECMFFLKDKINKWRQLLLTKFPYVYYGNINVPTYPCGQIGMMVCSKKYDPRNINNKTKLNIENLKYYNKKIHKSSFILPNNFKFI